MALLRYGFEEARNIERAERRAKQDSALNSSLNRKRIEAVLAGLAGKQDKETVQTVATDVNFTWTPGDPAIVHHTGTLTANRTIALSTSGATNGTRVRIVRSGDGGNTLMVGLIRGLGENEWCDVVYDGSAWILVAYGSL